MGKAKLGVFVVDLSPQYETALNPKPDYTGWLISWPLGVSDVPKDLQTEKKGVPKKKNRLPRPSIYPLLDPKYP